MERRLNRRAREGSRPAAVLLAWGPPALALALLALSAVKLVSSTFNPFIYFRF